MVRCTVAACPWFFPGWFPVHLGTSRFILQPCVTSQGQQLMRGRKLAEVGFAGEIRPFATQRTSILEFTLGRKDDVYVPFGRSDGRPAKDAPGCDHHLL